MLAADYPFLEVMWSMLVFFLWIMWFWLLFTVWFDIFRRDDISGWGKAGWRFVRLSCPFLGVFVYVITQNDAMTKRNIERARGQQAGSSTTTCVRRRGSGGARLEIEKAKQLLDSGAITQAEFDTMKHKALA